MASVAPQPSLESVHCITIQPGWKVLPELSPNFRLLLVLLPRATHNETITRLTTMEKYSTARLKDHHVHPVSCSHSHQGPLLKQPHSVGLTPSFLQRGTHTSSRSTGNGLPVVMPGQENPSPSSPDYSGAVHTKTQLRVHCSGAQLSPRAAAAAPGAQPSQPSTPACCLTTGELQRAVSRQIS